MRNIAIFAALTVTELTLLILATSLVVTGHWLFGAFLLILAVGLLVDLREAI